MRSSACLLLLLLLALAPVPAQEAAPNPTLSDFPIDNFASTTSPADVRFLLDAPAGKHGFIGVSGGHLATPDGKRIRFWGVNLAGWTKGSALLPPHHDAEVYASTLARLGINCVRFQFLDLPDRQPSRPANARATRQSRAVGGESQRPLGLIDGSREDTRSMDPEQLDRLDYLVYQLKLNGIYVDFNLNVGRVYKSGDGVKDYSLIGVAKAITYFDPRLVELQKEYARQLLTHRNPYTKTSYNDEPAIAIVEIVNENSVLEFWQRDWFRGNLTAEERPRYQLDLTPYYKKLLTTQYNAWLAKSYAPATLARIRSAAHVAAGEDVPILQRQQFDTVPSVRFYAEGEFYIHLETRFMEEMRDFIRKDLHVKSLIIGTADHTYFIAGMPLVRTTSRLDIVDAHIYWWPPSQMSHRGQEPMVNSPLRSIEVRLTRSTMAGKPFTVSEVNEPFPSDYGSEMIPLLASYGAFQDWDGIFIYAFEPKLSGQWQPVVGDHFDISEDPVKVAQMPVGALLFLRHDVAAARQTIERTYSTAQIDESMRLPPLAEPYWTPGFPLSLPLEHGSRIRCLDCAATAKFTDTPTNPIVSDTHQLSWHLSSKTGNGVVTVDTDRSTALVGFVKENNAETSHLSADVANAFCAITLSALDDQPLSRSGTMLLTATGRAENTGMVWDARRANVTNWGTAPTRIEVVKGWLLLKDIEGALAVQLTPLDGAGRPLPVVQGRLLAEGPWEIEIGQVPATSYLIKVIR
ncbi:MAG TPA: hypothetical protein VLJ11_10640 [Bryobacteraceae bacterium]|nr:hypothetical protein [Bryobacteraceae bacterium]